MGWAEEVHESRMQASLAQARKEYRLQKRGYPVPVQPDARLPSLFSLAAAGAALVWWRKEGRRLRGRDWRQLPLIKQLHELIMHGQVLPSASTVRGRQQKPPPPRPAKPSRAQQVRGRAGVCAVCTAGARAPGGGGAAAAAAHAASVK